MEHPDITSILATGYTRRVRLHSEVCDSCGEPLVDKRCWYKIDDNKICEDCLEYYKCDRYDAVIEEDCYGDY